MNPATSPTDTSSARLILLGNQPAQNEQSSHPTTGQTPTLANQPIGQSPLPAPGPSEVEKEKRSARENSSSITITTRPSTPEEITPVQKTLLQPCSPEDIAAGMREAVIHGDLEMLEFLVEKGGDVNHYYRGGRRSYTPTLGHLAIENGKPEILKWLIRHGFEINSIDGHGRSLLCLAIFKRDRETALWLMQQKGCDTKIATFEGKSCLHLAAEIDDLDLIIRLVESGLSIHGAGFYSRPPIYSTIEHGSRKTLEWMVANGIDIDNEKYPLKKFFYWAARKRNSEICKYLVDFGALAQYKNCGSTPLLEAVNLHTIEPERNRNDHVNTVKFVAQFSDMAFRLSVADYIGHANYNMTALMIAVKDNLYDLAPSLIEATLQHPDAEKLIHEALPLAKSVFMKELLTRALINPEIFTSEIAQATRQSASSKSGVSSIPLLQKIGEKLGDLHAIQSQLGSSSSGLTPLQNEAAKHGIFAGLMEWRIGLQDSSDIYGDDDEEIPASLLRKLTHSSVEEIDSLIQQGEQWESQQLKPIIHGLFQSCHSMSQNGMSVSDLEKVFSGSGFYQPIARRIAAAWEDARASHQQYSNSSSSQISQQASDKLRNSFRQALKARLDSAATIQFPTNDPAIPQRSKDLFSNLLARQLSLVAEFWRAE